MKIFVNTPHGRGTMVREYIFAGKKWITVRFFPPQHIINNKGKKMPNPNAGKYYDRSFRHSLCTFEERKNLLALIYKKLITRLNKP